MKKSMKPRAGAGAGGEGPWSLEADEILSQAPQLAAFLADARWDDGAPRVPGSLVLFMEEGTLKAALNDKDGGLVAFVSGATLAGLFEALDRGILTGGLDWRQSGGGGKKRQGSR